MELHERLSSHTRGPVREQEPFAELKNRVHMTVISELGPQLFNIAIDPIELRDRVTADVRRHLNDEAGLAREDRERLTTEILDDILGYGPLERLLSDDSITEVMCNGPDDIWIERGGKLYETTVRFTDDSHLRRITNKIVSQIGRRIDEASPMVDARILTIEDAAELQLHQRHVLRLEARPPNIEGEGHIPIRDLVRNSLRMRPDRIVVGEVRGAEALDMLQAMNTGHDGSLSTVHSNSPRDGLHRIETMVMMAGYDLPLRAIRQHIAAALDLLVHIDRMEDGSRRVVAVTEVLPMEADVIQLQDIFEFEIDSVAPDRTITGGLQPTGLRPVFLEKFRKRGIELPQSMFGERVHSLDERRGATA